MAGWLRYYFIDDVSVEEFSKQELSVSSPPSVCEGETVRIEASGDFDKVEWMSVGDPRILGTSRSLSVSLYESKTFVAVTKKCNNVVTDTFEVMVFPKPRISLPTDTSFCEGSILELDAGESVHYLWSNHSNERILRIVDPGTYSVKVWNEYNCVSTHEVRTTRIPIPKPDLGGDTILCNNSMTLRSNAVGQEFRWSTGSMNETLEVNASGIYSVTVRNSCGEGLDTVTVYNKLDIFIPNVITVNSDGYNDYFEINTPVDLTPRLDVFNSWGRLVFRDLEYKDNWPRDQSLSTGVYYYLLDFKNCGQFKGWLHVLR